MGLTWAVIARVGLGLGEGSLICSLSFIVKKSCVPHSPDPEIFSALWDLCPYLGVAYPAIHSMIGAWIPPGERSKAVAVVTASAYFGSVIALPTSSALVVSAWGWRGIFWLFGALGLIWGTTWQV